MNFNLCTHEGYEGRLEEAVLSVMRSRRFLNGPQLEQFEATWAFIHHSRHAIGVGSGTDALRLAMRALGIGPGSKVLTPAHNAAYAASAARSLGAENFYCDVDEVSMLMTPDTVADAIQQYGPMDAVVPVHLYGLMCPMRKIKDQLVAMRFRGVLIEDAAQAHGSIADDHTRPGAHSDAACFSHYPTKNLGAFGDAGSVVTHIASVAQTIRQLRDGGRSDRYTHTHDGYTSMIDEIQAAILNVKLANLTHENELRSLAARYYNDKLKSLHPDLVTPRILWGHTHHLYVVRTKHREMLSAHLAARGVPSFYHYPTLVPHQPGFADEGMWQGPWPVAQKIASEVISLPMHPYISRLDQDTVIEAIYEFFEK